MVLHDLNPLRGRHHCRSVPSSVDAAAARMCCIADHGKPTDCRNREDCHSNSHPSGSGSHILLGTDLVCWSWLHFMLVCPSIGRTTLVYNPAPGTATDKPIPFIHFVLFVTKQLYQRHNNTYFTISHRSMAVRLGVQHLILQARARICQTHPTPVPTNGLNLHNYHYQTFQTKFA